MNVLIIGHNPFNKELPNGRTLLELFSGFEKSQLAEIFLHPDAPNFEVCNRYYRIVDSEVLKGAIRFKKVGKTIDDSESFANQKHAIYKYGSKRKSYTVLLRNLLWKCSRWFHSGLKKWISDFKPDVIFLYLGNYYFAIDMATKISRYFDIPIVTYIVDDYYFSRSLKKGFWGRVNHSLYCSKVRRLLNRRTTICLNDIMKKQYASEFDCNYHVIYTTSSVSAFPEKKPEERLRMIYAGGIACERNQSLVAIGKVIDECNLPIDFYVYTKEDREWLREPLANAPCIQLCEGVSYEEVLTLIRECDIIVHVEGFSKDSEELVRYSMSTKIADALSCNRVLLAYGPSGIASIDYLEENQCAFVANNVEELKTVLSEICSGGQSIAQKKENALRVALANHTREQNHRKLFVALEETINEHKKNQTK